MYYLVKNKDGSCEMFSSPCKRGLIANTPFVNLNRIVVGTKEYDVSFPLEENYKALLAPYVFWNEWKWYLDRYWESRDEFSALLPPFKGCYLTLPPQDSSAMYGVFAVYRGEFRLEEYNNQPDLRFRPCAFWNGQQGKLLTPNDHVDLTPDQLKIFIGK